jgi:hypothetical protein
MTVYVSPASSGRTDPDDTGFDIIILAGQSNMHGADTA